MVMLGGHIQNFHKLSIIQNFQCANVVRLPLIVIGTQSILWICYWWLVSVTLLVAFGFLPKKIWEMAMSYELSFYLKRNAVSVMLTLLGSTDNETVPDGQTNY